MNTINSSNFVEEVLKDVKHYNIEPTYWLRIDVDGEYEAYVNDMPAFKFYKTESSYASPIPINYLLMKSGLQTVRIKIFSKNKDAYANIRVIEVDNRRYKEFDEKLIKKYEQTITMPDSGVYEGEFTFDALVPYDNKGWSEGQDLTKFDKKELESAVVAFYKKMWNIYNDKTKKEAKFPLFLEREREIAKSDYASKETLEEILKEYLLPYSNPTYEMLPLENYKMVFYGDGKAVALEQTSMVIQLRGYSALAAKYKTDMGSTLGDMSQMILYLPQGNRLQDGLQIIR